MKIRTKLLLIVSLSILVVAVLSVFLFFSVQFYNLSIEKNNTANKIVINLFDKNFLLSEYLLYYNDRPRNLWISKNDELVAYLKLQSSKFVKIKEQQLLKDLINRIGVVQQSFLQLVSAQQNIEQSTADSMAAAKYKQSRLVVQILINNQEIASAAERLSASSLQEANATRKTITYFSIGFFTALIFTIVIILYFVWFNILKPITELKQSALQATPLDSVSFSPVSFKVSTDEIGQMSKAFAGMVTKLQEAYQKLNKSNRELTATSKSFQEKMAEMEEFNKMMVGREIKMLELKKEIENLKKIKN